MSTQDLLIIVGCEELPARYVQYAATELKKNVLKVLKGIEHGAATTYAAPRHIAVSLSNVATHAKSETKVVTGPPADRAFVNGEPTKGAIGFARGKGVDVSDLKIIDGPRGPVVAVEIQTGGESTVELIQAGIEDAILKMDFEKSMRWGSGSVSWARPINKLVVLFGNTHIPCTVGNVASSTTDAGHRLFATPFEVASTEQWVQTLKDNCILVDREHRRSVCVEQLQSKTAELSADIKDWDLLDEVVDLVEFPKTIRCQFPEDLLELPPRLLVEAMKLHQKVFPLYNHDGSLRSDFLVITNHPFADESDVAATIAEGNKRVLTARFYDAKFFFAEDRKRSLFQHGERLQNMRWVRKGGTVAEKVSRLEEMSSRWAPVFGANPELLKRAATLCKCDLTTQMVYEFTDLQGHVGKLLAGFDGEEASVCTAIEEHYLPHGAGEEYPETAEGLALAFMDRLDSLQRCFELGLQPKGSSDALGLRRAANGLVRLFLSANVPLSFSSFLEGALLDFVLARMKSHFQDAFGGDIAASVLATGIDCPVSLNGRMIAMQSLSASPDFANMRATFKRVMGLTKEHSNTDLTGMTWVHPTEVALSEAFSAAHATVMTLLSEQEYSKALEALASLKPSIDALFDAVMVMDPDLNIRHNRLSLLRAIADDFRHLADFTILSV